MKSTNRRQFLKSGSAVAAGCVAAVSGLKSAARAATPAIKNSITVENARAGTQDWLLKNPRVTPPDRLWHMFGLRCTWIEGYCSHASVRAGDTLTVYVSSLHAARYTLDVYRMGYYGGDGGRLVRRFGPEQGRKQPEAQVGVNRVMECDWSPSIQFEIPGDWLSGVYVGKLTELNEGVDSYVIFIVRDDRRADHLFQCSDMTWQAYNRWPDRHSLYCDGKRDNFTGTGVDVGLNRPYGKYTQMLDQPLSTGSGEWFMTEFPIAFWMESRGYDVSYISNWDNHADGAGLSRGRGLLSVGHDEYWTQSMFDNVRTAIDNGLSAAFLSGNAVWAKLKLKRGADGRPERVFERDGRFDPRENTLMGAHSTPPVIGGADWVCRKPDHWIFEGTGMKLGEGVPGLVGWEFHGDPADIPGLEIVASDITDRRRFPKRDVKKDIRAGEFTATVYPGPEGNFVFNAATCWWADGLSEPPGYLRSDWYSKRNGPDPRVQKITANLLARMTRRV